MNIILFKEQKNLRAKTAFVLSFVLMVFTIHVHAQTNAIDSNNNSNNGVNIASDTSIQNLNQSNVSNPTNNSSNIGNLWQNWNLLLITLDKTDKPASKAEISLFKPVNLKKDKGPEISIQEIPLEEQNTGRWIRIQCAENVITQKFENPSQLKGWAVQFSCNKVKYYFIINFNGTN